MKPVRIIVRFIGLQVLVVAGLVLMGVYANRDAKAPINQKQKEIRKWWLRKINSVMGLSLVTKGNVPKDDETAMWISNHVSWLDIPVIGSEGASFLSKAEVRKWPVIGWLTEKSGALYIQRGGENASRIASQKIADKINNGHDRVMVFPEATTTDGKDVKKFHARIFAPAIDHGLQVQPIAIRYLDKEGRYHPKVAWGDESFMKNVFNILGEPTIYVELHFLAMIDSKEFSERRHLSEHAHQKIRDIVKTESKL